MNLYLFESLLVQIGISTLVIAGLYGLHRIVEGFDKENHQRLMRQHYARRWSDQEWMALLKSLSDRRCTSPFTVSTNWEDPAQDLDVMEGSTAADIAQRVSAEMLDRSEYSIIGEPTLQRIPVGITQRKDGLR